MNICALRPLIALIMPDEWKFIPFSFPFINLATSLGSFHGSCELHQMLFILLVVLFQLFLRKLYIYFVNFSFVFVQCYLWGFCVILYVCLCLVCALSSAYINIRLYHIKLVRINYSLEVICL